LGRPRPRQAKKPPFTKLLIETTRPGVLVAAVFRPRPQIPWKFLPPSDTPIVSVALPICRSPCAQRKETNRWGAITFLDRWQSLFDHGPWLRHLASGHPTPFPVSLVRVGIFKRSFLFQAQAPPFPSQIADEFVGGFLSVELVAGLVSGTARVCYFRSGHTRVGAYKILAYSEVSRVPGGGVAGRPRQVLRRRFGGGRGWQEQAYASPWRPGAEQSSHFLSLGRRAADCSKKRGAVPVDIAETYAWPHRPKTPLRAVVPETPNATKF